MSVASPCLSLPAAPPPLPVLAGADLARRRLTALVLAVALSVTVLQRFAVPGTGSIVGWGFLVCLAATAWGLAARRLRIDPARLVLYLAALSALLATLFVKWAPFSLASFLMLAMLYWPFVAMTTVAAAEFRLILALFQKVMLLSAVAGLAQFALQFALGPQAMFPFDRLLPESLFIPGFNLRIPIDASLPYLKSTGLWFLEPSHFSQALAFAILIELLYFRRPLRLLLFGLAYLTSFSGTGALLLLAMGLPLILRLRRPWLLAPMALLLLALPFLGDVPPFSLFLDRLGELSNPLASGSMRFLAPYWLIDDVLLGHPKALLFGYGPGRVEEIAWTLDYAVQDSSWLKLLIEYGLVGAVAFLAFYLYVLFAHSPDRLLSLACLVQFLFLGGYLNAFYVAFLHLVLVGWPRLAPAPDALALPPALEER